MENRRQIFIITSIDNDHQKEILSQIASPKSESIVVDLNEIKRQNIEKKTSKRRKADLTCVICQGRALGYNFEQITCESCKAFFRRNALHPIEKTKCLNRNRSSTNQRCEIRFDLKVKCQRCRLIKCLESGMRKDYILTPDEKRSKQEQIEANRRQQSIEPMGTFVQHQKENSSILSSMDLSCLQFLRDAYRNACESSPSASSVLSIDLAPDKMSAYLNTLDIQNFAAMKLINFVRQIPEFDQLNEFDRVLLVKSNLTLLFVVRCALTFDQQREIVYDLDKIESILPTEEAFAQHCKSLFILCYGYEFNRSFMSILHSVSQLIDTDSIFVQLLMLTMIFLKGLGANYETEGTLCDHHQVYLAHSKYIDLLFRYLMSKYSFSTSVKKMIQIVDILMKTQRVFRDFHQYIKTKIDVNHVNPLMKSLLNLT